MQTKNKNEIYKCPTCGNIVEVLEVGGGELICCGEPMLLQKENTVDASVEKHLPIIERSEKEITVIIGEVEHPMTSEHYIQWIELIADGKTYRQNLKPEDKPLAKFKLSTESDVVVRAYCNLHGLWKA
ncbi:MAG TPA: desulfoferrodoxin [Candidatus Moranbacteria bacterium]|nr:desulfoferrodoxin [Candidatus Moranbacteria bacterium]